jgi:CRISPR type IV-associated protein Csf1
MGSSELVCRSMNIEPNLSETVKAEFDAFCGYCGVELKEGDAVHLLKFKKSFIDQNLCADGSSKYACPHCNEIMNRSKFLLPKLSTGIFTEQGAYPVGKNTNRAYFLKNPPKPPFLFSVNIGQSQHIVWKAPVNLSNEVFFVQLSNHVISINHKKLMGTVKHLHKLRDIHSQALLDDWALNNKKPQQIDRDKLNPFYFLGMKGDVVGTYTLCSWLKDLVESELIEESELAEFKQLNWGEAWLLNAACIENEESNVKPETFTY